SVRNSDALDTGLLIARLVFGLTLSAHGAQKLFGWFGGNSLTATGGFFEQLGFRPGRLFAGLYQAAPPCSPGRMHRGGPKSILALGRIGTPDEALRLGA
ncbi:MAG TPA: DoxX family protein, partial [Gemmatimonadales bacterium]|nr:DoxX family protein [Gemmatimonadales bacterium]